MPAPFRVRTLVGLLAFSAAGPLLAEAAGAPAALAPASSVTWRLDHATSVGGHPATVLGAPGLGHRADEAGLVFDGVHDGLILDLNPIAGLKAFTVELRIRPDPDGPPEQRFFHVQDAAGARLLLELRLTKEKQWALDTFLLDGPSQLALLDRTKLHSADAWHWVALRYDGKHMSSYVDGQPELTGEVAFGPTLPSGQTSIGVRLNKVYWFKGGISEVRLSTSALPPTELAR